MMGYIFLIFVFFLLKKPYTATGVLRINPMNDTVQILGDYPYGEWKWHGTVPHKQTIFQFFFFK